MAEGVGHSHLLAVVPSVAHQVVFGIVGDELLSSFVALSVDQSHEDVALGV